MLGKHCVKSVQIRSFFWCVFSCIRTECRKIRMVILFTLNFISAKIFQRNIFSFLETCMAFIRLNFKRCISYVISGSKATLLDQAISAKNTVISPNLLLWKFCGKAQLPQSLGKLPGTMQKLRLSTKFPHEEIRWLFLIWFVVKIKWLVSIWNAKRSWNGLNSLETFSPR